MVKIIDDYIATNILLGKRIRAAQDLMNHFDTYAKNTNKSATWKQSKQAFLYALDQNYDIPNRRKTDTERAYL